jgi:hypothetical protein
MLDVVLALNGGLDPIVALIIDEVMNVETNPPMA